MFNYIVIVTEKSNYNYKKPLQWAATIKWSARTMHKGKSGSTILKVFFRNIRQIKMFLAPKSIEDDA